jgi:hypothetical protein
MPPALNFYANHTLDFENNDYTELQYYAISELRKLAIPDDILLMERNSLLLQFPDGDLFAFTKIAEWCPISFPVFSDERKHPEKT